MPVKLTDLPSALGTVKIVSVDAEGTSVYRTKVPVLGTEDVNDVTLAITFKQGGQTRIAEVDSLWVAYKGGWVQIYQTKGGKFVKETEWFRGYPEIVAAAVKRQSSREFNG